MKLQTKALFLCVAVFASSLKAASGINGGDVQSTVVADAGVEAGVILTEDVVKDINAVPVNDTKPLQQKELSPSQQVTKQIRDYMYERGLSETKATKGKRFYFATASVAVNTADPNFGRFLASAYTSAYMSALQKFSNFLGVHVSNQIQQEIFSDTSSNSREFEPESGESKLSVLKNKAIALAGAQLDDALIKLGVSSEKVKSLSAEEKKTLMKDSLIRRVRTVSSLSLGGVSILPRISLQWTPKVMPRSACFFHIRQKCRRLRRLCAPVRNRRFKPSASR